MTDKAMKILLKMRRRRRSITPNIDSILEQFNRDNLDDAGPVTGGDQELKVLKEMNELQEFENDNWSRGDM